MTAEEPAGSFHAKPVWQRGRRRRGAASNFLFAIVIFAIWAMVFGIHLAEPRVGDVTPIFRRRVPASRPATSSSRSAAVRLRASRTSKKSYRQRWPCARRHRRSQRDACRASHARAQDAEGWQRAGTGPSCDRHRRPPRPTARRSPRGARFHAASRTAFASWLPPGLPRYLVLILVANNSLRPRKYKLKLPNSAVTEMSRCVTGQTKSARSFRMTWEAGLHHRLIAQFAVRPEVAKIPAACRSVLS